MVRKLPLVLALLFAFAAPTWADFAAGETAHKTKDFAEAVKWFRRAAAQGHAAAQVNLGSIYGKGRGTPQNYAESAKWFRKAAEQGLDTAQFNLGLMYHSGRGVARNYAESAKWFREAAEQGVAIAQNNLGVMYYDGQGVTRNYVCAYMWLSLSGVQGTSANAKIMADLERHMTPIDRSRAQRLAAAWTPGAEACRPR